jgi:hypothetical protein
MGGNSTAAAEGDQRCPLRRRVVVQGFSLVL